MANSYRIVVISDTHKRFHALHEIVLKHKDEAACFIHLGDCVNEVEDMRAAYPDITLYAVRGNCDYAPQMPDINEVTIGGKHILFTHGHLQNVKYSLDKLKQFARNSGMDIVLYGHTHQSYTGYDKGLYIMNPGSPVQPRDFKPSYGIIDITPAGIALNIVSYGGY